LNPLLIIAGIAALYYAPTILGLMKLEYKIVSVIPTKIEANSITLQAGMELTNKSRTNLVINGLQCNVYLNGKMMGTILNSLNTHIPAGLKQVVGLKIIVTPAEIGNELWTMFINQNLENFVIRLQGNIKANGKILPLDAMWTIKDFVNGIGAVPKRGMSDDFLIRRQKAISELFEIQKSEEYKPMSFSTVERKVYYDKHRDTFRLIGKSYDYTSTF